MSRLKVGDAGWLNPERKKQLLAICYLDSNSLNGVFNHITPGGSCLRKETSSKNSSEEFKKTSWIQKRERGHPDVFNLHRSNTGTIFFFVLTTTSTSPFKTIHSQGGLFSMSHCLQSEARSSSNNNRRERWQKTNNNCAVFLGRGEKSQLLLSFSMIRRRSEGWGGGREKQWNVSWRSFGVELEPQGLILDAVGGDCVMWCVLGWGCVCQPQLHVCLDTLTCKYEGKKTTTSNYTF